MRYSGLHVVGFLLIVSSTTLLIISMATYHWTIQESNSGGNIVVLTYRGLFSQCTQIKAETSDVTFTTGEINCKNRLSSALFDGDSAGFMEEFHMWEIVAMGFLTVSVVISLVSVIFAQCCCDYIGFVQVFWLVLGSIATFGGVVCFAENSKLDSVSPAFVIGAAVSYNWSFWLAIGAGVGQFVSAVIFAAARIRVRQDQGGPVAAV